MVARGGRLGQARGGQRQIAREESTCHGSLSAVQAPAPHAPALTDDVMCWTLAKYLERRVTSAKRGRWAESKMLWLGGDQLVGALKKAGWIAPPLDAPRRSSAHSCIATSKVRLELLRTKDEDSSETRQADGDPRRGGSEAPPPRQTTIKTTTDDITLDTSTRALLRSDARSDGRCAVN